MVALSISLIGDLASVQVSEPWVSLIQLACLWGWTILLLRERIPLVAVAIIVVSATYLVAKIFLLQVF